MRQYGPPDSRRFARVISGIIYADLTDNPHTRGVEAMRMSYHSVTEDEPILCAEIDITGLLGSRCRVLVHPLPPQPIMTENDECDQESLPDPPWNSEGR